MANFTKALQEEITRLARKQVRSETEQLRRSSTQYRRDIAALKRQVGDLERTVAFLRKQEGRRVAEPEIEVKDKSLRFSPIWLRKHRERIGLSAEDYGKLVGVSGQSVYMWENEKSKPRPAQVAKLVAIRGLGKREAEQRLALLNGG